MQHRDYGIVWSIVLITTMLLRPGIANAQAYSTESTATMVQPPSSTPDVVPAPVERWWTPPDGGPAQRVEVLAYGFSGIDERDLGTVFTADLQRIAGAPRLFEARAPRRTRRLEIDKKLLRRSEHQGLDAGMSFLFVGIDASSQTETERIVYHSREVEEIVSLDDSGRMREPPSSAVFYLSAIHVGSSVDFFIEGDYAETGKKLKLLLAQGTASMQKVQSSGAYQIDVRGLGIRDVQRDGVWAMSVDEIARSHRAEPVPIELVFTTIPGRVYRPTPRPMPKVIVDELDVSLAEGASMDIPISEPGRYRFVARSRPFGIGIQLVGDVDCTSSTGIRTENKSIDIKCTARGRGALRLTNPTSFGLGPAETMSRSFVKLP